MNACSVSLDRPAMIVTPTACLKEERLLSLCVARRSLAYSITPKGSCNSSTKFNFHKRLLSFSPPVRLPSKDSSTLPVCSALLFVHPLPHQSLTPLLH